MREAFPLLIAEDNADDVWLLNAALRTAAIPCSAHFAENGAEVIDWLNGTGIYADRNQFPLPKLLITDIKMPKVDGFELMKWIRSEPKFSNLPLVVLSSSDLPEDVSRAQALGAAGCFRKTVGYAKLIQFLRAKLDS
ncbi:MAG: response regulator [Verrucomicrobiota bacterium]